MANYLAIAPEIALLVLVVIVLAYERFIDPSERRQTGIVTAWGLLAIIGFTFGIWLIGGEPSEAVNMDFREGLFWGDMIRHDYIALIFRVMFLAAALVTTLISVDVPKLQRSEYFGLLLMVTIGLNFMAMSTDIIMLYVALETASITLYIMAGFLTDDNRSVEAGMKYFVYGSFASALMLFGFSWIYGLTGGATQIYDMAIIAANIGSQGVTEANTVFLLAAVMVIVGFGFKISLVPFHFWTPDVYEGAPTAVTAFLSTASKAAGFAVFIRVFTAGVFGQPDASNPWWAMLAAMCIVTMILGNFMAIFQSNIKRMLAYSSIAQAGYTMIGLVILTTDGAGAAIYYLFMYIFTNIAAFGVIILVSNVAEAEEMTDLYGLSRRSPGLALVMMFALLSLGGIPPTAGFFGKFFLFRAAVDAGYWWLALIGILMAFVALYYYLNVIKYMYLYKPSEEQAAQTIPVSTAAYVALGVTFVFIVYLGVAPQMVFDWAQQAASAFLLG